MRILRVLGGGMLFWAVVLFWARVIQMFIIGGDFLSGANAMLFDFTGGCCGDMRPALWSLLLIAGTICTAIGGDREE